MRSDQIKRLLLRISDKDEDAFKELFIYYYPKLIQIALAFVPGIVSAQEVISDLFYKILKNPFLLEEVEDFDRYIFMAVRHQSYTYLKNNKHRVLFDSLNQKEDYILSDSRNPEDLCIYEELFHLVTNLVQQLPPKRKAIFMLVKEEGKKYKEVAEILDISVKTVELQMSLALKLLRKTVQDYLDSKDIKIRKLGGSNFFTWFL